MYFDINIWILQYRSTFLVYRTLIESTSISKLKNFDIKVHWNWILHPISKHFDIKVVYAISKIFQKLRHWSQHFDIVPQNHTLRYPSFFTLYRRYLKNLDIEDVTSIWQVLLRYRSLSQGPSRSLSNESQHPVSFIHATDSDILCFSRIYIMWTGFDPLLLVVPWPWLQLQRPARAPCPPPVAHHPQHCVDISCSSSRRSLGDDPPLPPPREPRPPPSAAPCGSLPPPPLPAHTECKRPSVRIFSKSAPSDGALVERGRAQLI